MNAQALLMEYLWSCSVSESRAVGMAVQLARADVLTAEERAYAGDVLLRDEARHARWARTSARSLGPCGELSAGTYGLRQFASPVAVLARLHFGESFLLRYEAQMREVMLELGRPDIAAGWNALVADEEEHTAWGRRTLDRLASTRPEWAQEIRAHSTMRGHPDRDVTRRFGEMYRARKISARSEMIESAQ